MGQGGEDCQNNASPTVRGARSAQSQHGLCWRCRHLPAVLTIRKENTYSPLCICTSKATRGRQRLQAPRLACVQEADSSSLGQCPAKAPSTSATRWPCSFPPEDTVKFKKSTQRPHDIFPSICFHSFCTCVLPLQVEAAPLEGGSCVCMSVCWRHHASPHSV